MKYTPWLKLNNAFGSYDETTSRFNSIVVCKCEIHRWFKVPNTANEIRLFIQSKPSEWVYEFIHNGNTYISSPDGKHSLYLLRYFSDWVLDNIGPKHNYIGLEYK